MWYSDSKAAETEKNEQAGGLAGGAPVPVHTHSHTQPPTKLPRPTHTNTARQPLAAPPVWPTLSGRVYGKKS